MNTQMTPSLHVKQLLLHLCFIHQGRERQRKTEREREREGEKERENKKQTSERIINTCCGACASRLA